MSAPEFLQVPDREAYYNEAESWAMDQSRLLRASRRIAWVAAMGVGAIAVLEALALILLIPLKTTVPYVVSVDRRTGDVQLTQRLLPGAGLTENEAVIQSSLAQYVLSRETFDAADLKEQYARVQLWSDEPTAQGYVRWMAKNNPESPLNLYPASVTRKITIKSVNILSKGTALVRFDAERVDPAANSSQLQPYAATVTFRFSGDPMRVEDRLINPLGFQVTHYRVDAETPDPVVAPSATPTGVTP